MRDYEIRDSEYQDQVIGRGNEKDYVNMKDVVPKGFRLSMVKNNLDSVVIYVKRDK